MMIKKTILQVTIMHPIDDEVTGLSLAQIGYEIDEGSWLGSSEQISTVILPEAEVQTEAMKLGNDGSFFSEYDFDPAPKYDGF